MQLSHLQARALKSIRDTGNFSSDDKLTTKVSLIGKELLLADLIHEGKPLGLTPKALALLDRYARREESNKLRCQPRTGTLCAPLRDNTKLANATSAGFHHVVMISLSTHEEHYYGVAYRLSSKHKRVMLNICPFCGVDMRPMHKGLLLDANGEVCEGKTLEPSDQDNDT